MDVFLSWSQPRSEAVAKALRDWLPLVLQSARPWLSREIEKGARWDDVIADKLETCSFGVICLTPENLHTDWIVFEAGALSKKVRDSRVCTYLLDLRPTDVVGPLAQFQHSTATQEDTRDLVETLNRGLGEQGLDPDRLRETFEQWWPKLEEQLATATQQAVAKPDKRGLDDKVDEMLLALRNVQVHLQRAARAERPAAYSLIGYTPHYSKGDPFAFGSGDDAFPLVLDHLSSINLRRFVCRTHQTPPALDEASLSRVVFRTCCEDFRDDLSRIAEATSSEPISDASARS